MGESEMKSSSCEMDRSREFFHGRVHFSFHDFALETFEKKGKCGKDLDVLSSHGNARSLGTDEFE